ncbi:MULTISPECIES: hypothetical protein [unclassified Anabaena]|uniref:hypothetical protein n=1 Tax=unclassified Anabaena TaxID=2619674 RepID=UPI000831BBD0|nr:MULTISPECIES: hypothetical protein [unclassified Anabaena]
MKTFNLGLNVPALAISLVLTETVVAQTPVIQVSRNLPSDPLILNGTSEKTVPSNCGNVPTAPNQVIEVTQSIPYLRVTAQSPGKPTLLIDGPGGRFCVLSDSSPDSLPELSGHWQAGKYSVSVGNLTEQQYNYTILISQQKKQSTK